MNKTDVPKMLKKTFVIVCLDGDYKHKPLHTPTFVNAVNILNLIRPVH